ncbi:hypothetical protein [Flagellimonas algicola]|uniref:PKD domain-containing protein n=1 Tax=Flagellimonas algicola TaxID=2583815 RepID=A0ABY2WRU5_9FLAO|nr:hypothetical protein [Allomuricauda algicola]TMU57460.1 hypothetical protein FGG15_07930 [Allomuricauda algicola]
MTENSGHIANATMGKVHLPLYDFFLVLKQHNFLVTPQQITEANQVIKKYADKVKSEMELCNYLVPIFAKSQEEQHQFIELFEEYYAQKEPSVEPSRTTPSWVFLLIVPLLLATLALLYFYPDPPPPKEHQIYLETITSSVDPLAERVEITFSLEQGSEHIQLDHSVDWGDGTSKDNLLKHDYREDGIYNITAYVQFSDEGVAYYDTITKAQRICIAQSSLILTRSFEGDSIAINRDFELSATLIGNKKPEQTTWVGSDIEIIANESIEPNTENQQRRQTVTMRSRITEVGNHNFEFLANYNQESCNVGEDITLIAYDPNPYNPTTDRSNPFTAHIYPSDGAIELRPNYMVRQKWFNVLFGLLALSTIGMVYFFEKRWKLKKAETEKTEENKTEYGRLTQSFKGKKGAVDIPFIEKNYLPYPEAEMNGIATQMRSRISDKGTYLHVQKTITKAIQHAGFFNPVLVSRTQQSEFLVLIDRNYTNDQQAKLFDFLIDLLRKRNVLINKFYFKIDPSLCYSEKENQPINLETLSEKYPEHILLLFGNGYQLIYPDYPNIKKDFVQLFERWRFKAVITPASFMDWGNKEHTVLKPHLPIFPVDIPGLLLLMPKLFREGTNIDTLLSQYTDQFYKVAPIDFEDLDELYTYCENVDWAKSKDRGQYGNVLFQWIAALAVYPKIRWELLLSIGKAVLEHHGLGHHLNFTSLLLLARVDWIKLGEFPDFTRFELLKHLTKENEIVARETILKVLKEIPEAELNSTHFAYEEKETQRLMNEFTLYAHDPISYSQYKDSRALFELLLKDDHVTDGLTKAYLENPKVAWPTLINGNPILEGTTSSTKTVSLSNYLDLEDTLKEKRSKLYGIWVRAASIIVCIATAGLLFLSFANNSKRFDNNLLMLREQQTRRDISLFYKDSILNDSATRKLELRLNDSTIYDLKNSINYQPQNDREVAFTLKSLVVLDSTSSEFKSYPMTLVRNDSIIYSEEVRFDSNSYNISFDVDRDGDDFPDNEDECPDVFSRTNKGCPEFDQVYWNAVKNQNTTKAYLDYLKNSNPNHESYREAVNILDSLLSNRGFVQFQETNGNELFEKYHDIPNIGQFYFSKRDQTIRDGAIGKTRKIIRRTGVIRTGDIVKLLRLENVLPNSIWAEIAFGGRNTRITINPVERDTIKSEPIQGSIEKDAVIRKSKEKDGINDNLPNTEEKMIPQTTISNLPGELNHTNSGSERPALYVWDFSTEIPELKNVASELTSDFETELINLDRYRILDRRNYSRLVSVQKIEEEASDIKNLTNSSIDNLEVNKAEIVVFGELKENVNSGEYNLTVIFQKLNGEISRKSSIFIRRGLISDNTTREESIRKLILQLHEREIKETQQKELESISNLLYTYLLRVEEVWRSYGDISFMLDAPSYPVEFSNQIEAYNEIFERIHNNRDKIISDFSTNWDKAQTQVLNEIIESIIYDVHERNILKLDQVRMEIDRYRLEKSKKVKKRLREEIIQKTRKWTGDLQFSIELLKVKTESFLNDLRSKLDSKN